MSISNTGKGVLGAGIFFLLIGMFFLHSAYSSGSDAVANAGNIGNGLKATDKESGTFTIDKTHVMVFGEEKDNEIIVQAGDGCIDQCPSITIRRGEKVGEGAEVACEPIKNCSCVQKDSRTSQINVCTIKQPDLTKGKYNFVTDGLPVTILSEARASEAGAAAMEDAGGMVVAYFKACMFLNLGTWWLCITGCCIAGGHCAEKADARVYSETGHMLLTDDCS